MNTKYLSNRSRFFVRIELRSWVVLTSGFLPFIVLKRYVGGIGHASKVVAAIAKNKGVQNAVGSQIHNNTTNVISPTSNPNTFTTIPNPTTTSVINQALEFVKRIIPKTSYTHLLEEARKKNIIKYENTAEYPASGSAKLTIEGIKLYNQIHTNTVTTSTDIILNISNNIYHVVMLNIHENTVIPLSKQMHLVVVYDNKTNQYIAIGTLTSEESPLHIKLSETQPISDTTKAQYFKPFDKPLSVKEEQLEFHVKSNEYINNVDITKTLDRHVNNMNRNIVSYTSTGVTWEDFKLMLELKKEQEEKVLPVIEKASNFLIEEKENKAKLKKEKADLNKLKQKELTQLNKLKEKK